MLNVASKMLAQETHCLLNMFHWILAQESPSGTFPARTATGEQLSRNQAPPCKEGCTRSASLAFPTIHGTPTLCQPLQNSVLLWGNVLLVKALILLPLNPARPPDCRLAAVFLTCCFPE